MNHLQINFQKSHTSFLVGSTPSGISSELSTSYGCFLSNEYLLNSSCINVKPAFSSFNSFLI